MFNPFHRYDTIEFPSGQIRSPRRGGWDATAWYRADDTRRWQPFPARFVGDVLEAVIRDGASIPDAVAALPS